MIDLMLDIETLGRGPGCVVPQVAIVPFHINGTHLSVVDTNKHTFNHKLCIGEQLARGYTIDPDTLDWWKKQKSEVRLDVFTGSRSLGIFRKSFQWWLEEVIEEFTTYRIWASAPKLDFGCLHTLLAEPGLEYPLLYSAERDLRTLKETVKMLDTTFKLPKGFNPHDAVEDCKRQIIDAQACYAFLQSKHNPEETNGKQTTKPSGDVHENVRTDSGTDAGDTVERDMAVTSETIPGGVERVPASV